MKLYKWALGNIFIQIFSAGLAYISYQALGEDLLAAYLALLILVISSLLLTRYFFGVFFKFLHTTELALLHFKDGEFSLKIPDQKNPQLHHIAGLFHEVADTFHKDRSSLLQRELLLDRVFETVSSALLLADGRERIVLCNPAARQLLGDGKAIKGLKVSELLPRLSPALAESIAQRKEVLFTLEGKGGEPETWQLSCEEFRLNGQVHTLFHFKQMTRTLSRAEVDTWKKVIRVLSHELNNSLSPISSLAHSGKHIISSLSLPPKENDMLNSIFSTVEHSASTLTQFLSNYAKFARLPSPILADIEWSQFLNHLHDLLDFRFEGDLPKRKSLADAGQLTQVFINLIKNANEAGAAPETIKVEIIPQGEWDKITVSDGGTGMQDVQLEQAMLPFYSTKRDGTGLGLSLCREIIDAHNGRITVANREEGGLKVSIWLPAKI